MLGLRPLDLSQLDFCMSSDLVIHDTMLKDRFNPRSVSSPPIVELLTITAACQDANGGLMVGREVTVRCCFQRVLPHSILR